MDLKKKPNNIKDLVIKKQRLNINENISDNFLNTRKISKNLHKKLISTFNKRKSKN